MGDAAALSLIMLTRPRASAKTSLGVSQPPVAETAAPAIQQKQNFRRESACDWVRFMSCFLLLNSQSSHSVCRLRFRSGLHRNWEYGRLTKMLVIDARSAS